MNFVSSINRFMFCSLAFGQIISTLSWVDNDVLLQSLDHGQFVGSGLDDTPFGVVQHAAFGGYIAVLVLRGVAVERTPCADIGPPTLAAADIYIFGLLHNPEINRNVAALGVDLLDILCLLWGGIIRRQSTRTSVPSQEGSAPKLRESSIPSRRRFPNSKKTPRSRQTYGPTLRWASP